MLELNEREVFITPNHHQFGIYHELEFWPSYLHIFAFAVLVGAPVEPLQPLPQLGHEVDTHHVLLPALQRPIELSNVELPVAVVDVLEDPQLAAAALLHHRDGVVVEGLGGYSVLS